MPLLPITNFLLFHPQGGGRLRPAGSTRVQLLLHVILHDRPEEQEEAAKTEARDFCEARPPSCRRCGFHEALVSRLDESVICQKASGDFTPRPAGPELIQFGSYFGAAGCAPNSSSRKRARAPHLSSLTTRKAGEHYSSFCSRLLNVFMLDRLNQAFALHEQLPRPNYKVGLRATANVARRREPDRLVVHA